MSLEVDIEVSVAEKMSQNKERYSVEVAKGNAEKW